MFYANNEQVKGIFLNGRNYNYLAYGFGKIIPEDRSAEQLNLNLASKYLNQYRIVFGTVKDGYDNALVSPRFDKPDSNGVFHTPFTYYYNNNIIPTKEVNVLITNGEFALSNALVYNDMNINGAVNYFAVNTDFQGHNVNVYPEKDNYQASPRLYYEMLNNCSNFDLSLNTRFSKSGYPTLYNCFNFSGNFKYVGNADRNYPGFRGFLYQCRDGVFNIDCTNMHGGGSDANTHNYYNFAGIASCSNINLNIIGSPWQVWPHDHSFTNNCNINTYNVISGFSYMNDCNFNVVLPKDSKPEMDSGFEFLNNAENCNYNLYATDVNLFNYRSGVGHAAFFNGLNNCNLNLQVNNTVSFDYSFGSNFNNCNIVFDNIKATMGPFDGWSYLYNCNISGNVEATSTSQAFIEYCDGLNINLNAAKSSLIIPMWRCHNVKGNLVAGDMTYATYCSYMNLNVSKGTLNLAYDGHCRFNLNGTNIYGTNLNNIYARVNNNMSIRLYHTNNTNIYSEGSNVNILGANNCYNLKLTGLTFNTTDSDSLFENVYNSDLKFGITNPYYRLWRVENCTIDGFPRGFAYVNNCVFRPFTTWYVGLSNSEAGTWQNLWSHKRVAGIRSTDNIRNCRIYARGWGSDGSITFNNVNNMQTSVGTYYNGVVTANLPIYNMAIKLNVDCHYLNLGIFQAGPPHGFENATISANSIYAKNTSAYYVQISNGVRLYCENFCDVPFAVRGYGTNEPVMLINNYRTSNSSCRFFEGGLTRIGRLIFQGGAPIRPNLNNGACLFINNAVLSGADVDNSLLFVGSNVTWTNGANVTNGGRIRNAANLTSDDINFINRGQFCWNLWDYGPWGSYRLIDFCTSV